jgi:hypothetical protein
MEQILMKELQTPCGYLNLYDESGELVSFDVCTDERTHLKIYDEIVDEHISVKAVLEEIKINPSSLVVGKKYVLKVSGNLHFEYGDADEYSISNVVSTSDASLSLGAYDPNDIEKDKQYIPNERGGMDPPAQYDQTNFHGYVILPLEDWSGFSFQLLDYSIPVIKFKLAWIEHLHDVKVSEYQNVVTSLSMF